MSQQTTLLNFFSKQSKEEDQSSAAVNREQHPRVISVASDQAPVGMLRESCAVDQIAAADALALELFFRVNEKKASPLSVVGRLQSLRHLAMERSAY